MIYNTTDQKLDWADRQKQLGEKSLENQVGIWRSIAEGLYDLLDNIDTAEDIAKENDKLFRNLTRNEYKKKINFMESDGYDLYPSKKQLTKITNQQRKLSNVANNLRKIILK